MEQFQYQFRKLNKKVKIDPITSLKTIMLVLDIVLGLWDELSDILYLMEEEIYNSYFSSLLIFFIFASPVVQTLAYMFVLGQINLKISGIASPGSDIRLQSAKSVLHLLCIFIKVYGEYLGMITMLALKQLPKALLITILQELKIFGPSAIFYIKKKYNIILTEDLISFMRPIIEKKRELALKNRKKQDILEREIKEMKKKQKEYLKNQKQQSKNRNSTKAKTTQILAYQDDLENQTNKNENKENNKNIFLNVQKQPIVKKKKENADQDVMSPLGSNNDMKQQNLSQKQEQQSDRNEDNYDQDGFILQQQSDKKLTNQDQEKTNINLEEQEEDGIEFYNQQQKKEKKIYDEMDQFKIDKKDWQIEAEKEILEVQSRVNNSLTEDQKLTLFLDSSMRPNMKILIEDQNLKHLMVIGNILEAFFESLPQAILQFLNNVLVNQKNNTTQWNIFQIATFATSCFTLFINAIKLIQLLIGEKLDVFYSVLRELDNNKQFIEKHTSKKEYQKQISVKSLPILEKMSLADPQNLNQLEILEIDIQNLEKKSEKIIGYCTDICKKEFKSIQRLQINVRGTNIDEATFKYILVQQFLQYNPQTVNSNTNVYKKMIENNIQKQQQISQEQQQQSQSMIQSQQQVLQSQISQQQQSQQQYQENTDNNNIDDIDNYNYATNQSQTQNYVMESQVSEQNDLQFNTESFSKEKKSAKLKKKNQSQNSKKFGQYKNQKRNSTIQLKSQKYLQSKQWVGNGDQYEQKMDLYYYDISQIEQSNYKNEDKQLTIPMIQYLKKFQFSFKSDVIYQDQLQEEFPHVMINNQKDFVKFKNLQIPTYLSKIRSIQIRQLFYGDFLKDIKGHKIKRDDLVQNVQTYLIEISQKLYQNLEYVSIVFQCEDYSEEYVPNVLTEQNNLNSQQQQQFLKQIIENKNDEKKEELQQDTYDANNESNQIENLEEKEGDEKIEIPDLQQGQSKLKNLQLQRLEQDIIKKEDIQTPSSEQQEINQINGEKIIGLKSSTLNNNNKKDINNKSINFNIFNKGKKNAQNATLTKSQQKEQEQNDDLILQQQQQILEFPITGQYIFDIIKLRNVNFSHENFYFDSGMLRAQLHRNSEIINITDEFNLKLLSDMSSKELQLVKQLNINLIEKTDQEKIDLQQDGGNIQTDQEDILQSLRILKLCDKCSKIKYPSLEQFNVKILNYHPKYINYKLDDQMYQNLSKKNKQINREHYNFDESLFLNHITKPKNQRDIQSFIVIQSSHMLGLLSKFHNLDVKNTQNITTLKIQIDENIKEPLEKQLIEFCDLKFYQLRAIHFILNGNIKNTFEKQLLEHISESNNILPENFKFETGSFSEYLKENREIVIQNQGNLEALGDSKEEWLKNIESLSIEIPEYNEVNDNLSRKIRNSCFLVCQKRFPSLEEIKWKIQAVNLNQDGQIVQMSDNKQKQIQHGNLPYLINLSFENTNQNQVQLEKFKFDYNIYYEYLSKNKIKEVYIDNLVNLFLFKSIDDTKLKILGFSKVTFNLRKKLQTDHQIIQQIIKSQDNDINNYEKDSVTKNQQDFSRLDSEQKRLKDCLRVISNRSFLSHTVFTFNVIGYNLRPDFQEKICNSLQMYSNVNDNQIQFIMDYPKHTVLNNRYKIKQFSSIQDSMLYYEIEHLEIQMQSENYDAPELQEFLEKICSNDYPNLKKIEISVGNQDKQQQISLDSGILQQIDEINQKVEDNLAENKKNKKDEKSEQEKQESQLQHELLFNLRILEDSQQNCLNLCEEVVQKHQNLDIMKQSSEKLCLEQHKILTYIKTYVQKKFINQEILQPYKIITQQIMKLYMRLKKNQNLEVDQDQIKKIDEKFEKSQLIEVVNIIQTNVISCIEQIRVQANTLQLEINDNKFQLGEFDRFQTINIVEHQFKNFKSEKEVQLLMGGNYQEVNIQNQAKLLNQYANKLYNMLKLDNKNQYLEFQHFLFNCPISNYKSPDCKLCIFGSKIIEKDNTFSVNPIGARLFGSFFSKNRFIINLTLELDGNELGNQGLDELSVIIEKNSFIKKFSLQISENQIGKRGIDSLVTALKKNSTIQEFSLGLNQNEIADLTDLCHVLEKSQYIQDLNLQLMDNKFEDYGCIALQRMIKNNIFLKSLKLNISFNKITRGGLIHLITGIQSNYHLVNLHLSLIGNEGIDDENGKKLLDQLQNNLRLGFTLDIKI